MALVGRYNSLQVVKHTNFGLYLDGGADGEILLPNRYIPKDIPSEDEDWLNVFVYLDSADKLIATTEKPKVQVGEFASLKVVDINRVGLFFDWGLPKDLLLPHSEEKRPLQIGDKYCALRRVAAKDDIRSNIHAGDRPPRCPENRDVTGGHYLELRLDADRVVQHRLDLVPGQLVHEPYLVGVHEARVAHHVAAVGEIDGEDRSAAVLHGAGAVVVEFFVVVGADVAAREHFFEVLEEGLAATLRAQVVDDTLAWMVGWSLILEYSLVVSAVAVPEILYTTKNYIALYYKTYEMLAVLTLICVLLFLPLSLLLSRLERRLQHGQFGS